MNNIAIIISSLGGGGTQQYVASLVSHFKNKNFNVYIFQTDYRDNKVGIDERNIINLVNTKKGFRRNFDLIKAIRKNILIYKIDIIISFLPKVNCISCISKIGLKAKLIVCERNDPIRQKLSLKWHFLRRFCYIFANAITANSKYAISILEKWYPLKKHLYFTSNYIRKDIQKVNKKIEVFKNDPYKFRILSVGRLSSQKNFKELIKAFAIIEEKNSSLYIIGDGPEYNSLLLLIKKLQLENRVFLIPYNKNIFSWMANSDLNIMTSLYEGSPNVLWEASSLSLPSIISSSIESAFEVLEPNHSVLKYQSGNMNELAKKINLLLEDKKLRELISINAHNAIKNLKKESIFYIWDKIFSIISK